MGDQAPEAGASAAHPVNPAASAEATHLDTPGRPQAAMVPEVTALVGEFRLLLAHLARHQKADALASPGVHPLSGNREGPSSPSPAGVHIELLTASPEKIAADGVLLQQLYSSVSALSAVAAPATVSSIYLTSAFLRDGMSLAVPAEAKLIARRLRRWALITVLLALLLFIVTITLLVHVDRGRREIQQLEHITDEYQLVVTAIDQMHDAVMLADCVKPAPGVEAPYMQPSVHHGPLCQRLRDVLRRMAIVRTELREWNTASDRPLHFIFSNWLDASGSLGAGVSEEQWSASEMRTSAIMAGFTGFVLPMLLGLLGAFTYVYRVIDRHLRTATLLPGDGAHGTLRVLLGAILGGLLGVIWTNGQSIQVEGVALSLAALAFFVGYSVEVMFQVMDNLVLKAAGALRK